jgi:hypothetical protein
MRACPICSSPYARSERQTRKPGEYKSQRCSRKWFADATVFSGIRAVPVVPKPWSLKPTKIRQRRRRIGQNPRGVHDGSAMQPILDRHLDSTPQRLKIDFSCSAPLSPMVGSTRCTRIARLDGLRGLSGELWPMPISISRTVAVGAPIKCCAPTMGSRLHANNGGKPRYELISRTQYLLGHFGVSLPDVRNLSFPAIQDYQPSTPSHRHVFDLVRNGAVYWSLKTPCELTIKSWIVLCFREPTSRDSSQAMSCCFHLV